MLVINSTAYNDGDITKIYNYVLEQISSRNTLRKNLDIQELRISYEYTQRKRIRCSRSRDAIGRYKISIFLPRIRRIPKESPLRSLGRAADELEDTHYKHFADNSIIQSLADTIAYALLGYSSKLAITIDNLSLRFANRIQSRNNELIKLAKLRSDLVVHISRRDYFIEKVKTTSKTLDELEKIIGVVSTP